MWIEDHLLARKADHLRRLLTLCTEQIPSTGRSRHRVLAPPCEALFSFASLAGILEAWKNGSPRVSFSARSMSNLAWRAYEQWKLQIQVARLRQPMTRQSSGKELRGEIQMRLMSWHAVPTVPSMHLYFGSVVGIRTSQPTSHRRRTARPGGRSANFEVAANSPPGCIASPTTPF